MYEAINPEELGAPNGWTNGMLAPAGGRILFIAGQDAATPEGHVATDDFVEQFEADLAQVLDGQHGDVVRAVGDVGFGELLRRGGSAVRSALRRGFLGATAAG